MFPRYHFSGSGGECIRNYWEAGEDEYIVKTLNRCKTLPSKDSRMFEASIKRIMHASFDELREKFAGFGRSVNDNEAA